MSILLLALYHALRADLAIISSMTGLRMAAIADVTNRALPHFRLNATGEVESLSGETIGDWVSRLRHDKPFYFHETDCSVDAAAPSGRTVTGKVGDGAAITRLALSNGDAA